MADPTNKIGEPSENQDNIPTTFKVDSIAVCKIPPTTESHHKERGLSILITYMECFFAVKTAVCKTNITILIICAWKRVPILLHHVLVQLITAQVESLQGYHQCCFHWLELQHIW
jgi:hypothetical protein